MPKRKFNYLGTIQCTEGDGFREEAWKKLIAETDGMEAAKYACVASPLTGELLLVGNRQRPFLARIKRNGQLIGVLAGDSQLVELFGELPSPECRSLARDLKGKYQLEKVTIGFDESCTAAQMMLAIGSGDAAQLEKLLRVGRTLIRFTHPSRTIRTERHSIGSSRYGGSGRGMSVIAQGWSHHGQ